MLNRNKIKKIEDRLEDLEDELDTKSSREDLISLVNLVIEINNKNIHLDSINFLNKLNIDEKSIKNIKTTYILK